MLKVQMSKLLNIGLACLIALGLFTLSACETTAQTPKTAESDTSTPYTLLQNGILYVATSPDIKPMVYQEGNDIKGYEIDLIKEIASRLNLTPSIHKEPIDMIFSQIAGGALYDCSISSIVIDPNRTQDVAFSNSYFDRNIALVVQTKGTITNKEQLADQPVAAQVASDGEQWVKDNLPKANYIPFQKVSDMLDALHAGKVKAIVIDESVAKFNILDEYKDLQIIEVIPTGEQYGIIVKTDNAALAEAINGVLAQMQEDGTIAKLQETWFGPTPPPAAPVATPDQATKPAK